MGVHDLILQGDSPADRRGPEPILKNSSDSMSPYTKSRHRVSGGLRIPTDMCVVCTAVCIPGKRSNGVSPPGRGAVTLTYHPFCTSFLRFVTSSGDHSSATSAAHPSVQRPPSSAVNTMLENVYLHRSTAALQYGNGCRTC